MKCKGWVVLVFMGHLLWGGAAFAERVALVIGNSDYAQLSGLKNPANDAPAVAMRLAGLGFRILQPVHQNTSDHGAQLDLSSLQFLEAKVAFTEAADGADVAFFYYAGHGTQLGSASQAYILPVDAIKPKKRSQMEYLERQSYPLQTLMNDLNGKAKLTVAVFDACRDIPALNRVRTGLGQGQGRGLSRLGQVMNGQIVAYAGAAGQVVDDGWLKTHSPYTEQLLVVLDEYPEQEFGDLFRDVATRVKSSIKQDPVVEIQGVPPREHYLRQPTVVSPVNRLQKAIDALDSEDSSAYALALNELSLLAGSGQPEALFRLGVAHYVGRGTRVNKGLGCQLIKQAGDKGHVLAKESHDELLACR